MTKANLRDPEQWIPRDLFAAYCGPSSDKLLAYYDKAKAKRQLITASFDAFAFLLLPAWFGYRQQWTLWAALNGCLAAIAVAEIALRMQLPTGAFGGGMIALGLMARGLLLSNANGLYLKLKQQGLADDAIGTALAGRASPRAGHAALALLASLAIGIGAALFTPSEYP
jgi:hypothetical protein